MTDWRLIFRLAVPATVVHAFSFTRDHISSRFHSSSTSINHLESEREQQQKAALIRRGELEATLMADLQSPLQPTVFEGSNHDLLGNGRILAETLRREGVVRIDGALPDSQFVDLLRDSVLERKRQAESDVRRLGLGVVAREDRFAKCLLSDSRCDLLLPLEGACLQATQMVLDSAVGTALEHTFGPKATLYELACLISSPGAARQNVHPDHPCLDVPGLNPRDPLCVSCFVALQDIVVEMGPTAWIPQTHNRKAHDRFQRIRVEDVLAGESPKDQLLRTTPSKLGLLPRGACALFDSRILHCGGANASEDTTRALFYFTFKHPDVDFPGNKGSLGYGLKDRDIELGSLRRSSGVS